MLKKQLLLFLLCAVLIIGVISCSTASTSTTTSTTALPSTSAPTTSTVTQEWRLSTFNPPQHTSVLNIFTPWAKAIEEKTGGRLKLVIFPGGALGKDTEQYDLVVKGIADVCQFTQGFTPGRFPLTSVMELPFVVNTTDATSRALVDLYKKFPEIQKEYSDTHLIYLGVNAPMQLYTTKKPVRTLEDLKGMTIRASGQATADMLKALGANPVLMPISDLYEAMQKGTIDGTLALYEAAMGFRLHEVTKYVTEINISTTTVGFTVNKDSWNKLPADIQNLLDWDGELGCEYLQELNTKAFDEGTNTGIELLKGANVEFITLSPSEKQRWIDATSTIREQWVSDLTAKGLPAEDVLNSAIELIEKYSK